MKKADAAKRSAGRPKSGKTRILISIDPEVLAMVDQGAKNLGMPRSTYIEMVLRLYRK